MGVFCCKLGGHEHPLSWGVAPRKAGELKGGSTFASWGGSFSRSGRLPGGRGALGPAAVQVPDFSFLLYLSLKSH